ncbi:hypothetical protein EV421DRAFT_913383 [Armillaria borealis]|uniref:F-box domain-containing protein n=1 Tax=Armillaria borealis TaxID=47425 RepID=A0AA39N049_9AGAR|nr:hypothetical protein EV421DRAFT_913383 [Armillaria borealis]
MPTWQDTYLCDIQEKGIMNATDAVFHLDAVARSAPEPLLPPNALNSQVSGILRATRPLLDTDRSWILQNIEDLQQQISVYDALLDRIDEVRLEMQRRRDTVHKSMAAYSSTLAPIRRLPIDALRTVFREIQFLQWWDGNSRTYTLPGQWSWKEPPVLDFLQGPWALSHVCGAWRDIVLSYPRLWSYIVLHFRTIHPMEPDIVLALKAMISRSAQHPLDIVFKLDGNHNEYAAVPALSVILEESYRWRSMHLQISLTLLERLKVVRGKIPCLESLCMKTSCIPQSSRGELPEDVRSVFVEAPCLRKVALHDTYNLGDFMFPHHITHLAAYVDNVSNLEVYRSLVECHLETDDSIDHEIVFPYHIHLPKVRRLIVSSPSILPHLRLPSLDDLMIGDKDAPAAVATVNDFIYRSRCSLTRFTTDNLMGQAFIEDTLLLMDTLVSLDTRLIRNEKAILDALASVGFLPNLQHLTLRTPSSIQASLWGPLTAMVSMRSQFLRSIRISCVSRTDVESINKHLAPIRPPGLQLIVSTSTNIHEMPRRLFGNFWSSSWGPATCSTGLLAPD